MKICKNCGTPKEDVKFDAKNLTCKSCKKAKYNAKARALNPAAILLSDARTRAKKKGIEFTIKIEDIVIPEVCPYLSIALVTRCAGGVPTHNSTSLDRINPLLGYVAGNVEVISNKANMCKSNLSVEELLGFAKAILKRLE